MLRIKNLAVEYGNGNAPVVALHSVSLALTTGDSLGIMGESGAGKTTLVQAILGLLGNSACVTGTVYISGRNQAELSARDRRMQLGKSVAVIPQASQQVLNPVQPLGHQMIEHIRFHTGKDRPTALDLARRSLRELGLEEGHLQRYPHQLSGGQRQRAVIVLVCSVAPDLIIADEATHALDVATQEQVLDYLRDKNQSFGTTLLVIGHNPQVIGRLCRQVAVFNQGAVVERGNVDQVFRQPRHPFTRELIAAYRATGERLATLVRTPLAAKRQRSERHGFIDDMEGVQDVSSSTAIPIGS